MRFERLTVPDTFLHDHLPFCRQLSTYSRTRQIQHPTKALEFSQFTMSDLTKQVRIVIDDQVVQEPVIQEPQVGSVISLGMKDIDEAVALRKRLKAKWDPNQPHAPDPHTSRR
jgi:hypothetical protein